LDLEVGWWAGLGIDEDVEIGAGGSGDEAGTAVGYYGSMDLTTLGGRRGSGIIVTAASGSCTRREMR
jgi:hypothetical protein